MLAYAEVLHLLGPLYLEVCGRSKFKVTGATYRQTFENKMGVFKSSIIYIFRLPHIDTEQQKPKIKC